MWEPKWFKNITGFLYHTVKYLKYNYNVLCLHHIQQETTLSQLASTVYGAYNKENKVQLTADAMMLGEIRNMKDMLDVQKYTHKMQV